MPAEKKPPTLRVLFILFAVELFITLLIQLPAVADFQKFGFYDEGAWLHLDQLFAGGAVPTVDVGYSYGMLPLMASRVWFAVFGRTPWAFIGFVTLCNLLAAWGIARILHTTGTSWGRLWAACALLPLAIMPNAYSLMHPLEMLLIISALAQQARGRYGAALAFATLGVLTKPSMAYVLGLLLLLLAAWLRKGWRIVLPPAVAGVTAIVGMIAAVGLRPAYANILPLTGGASYRKMNFGIFHAGMGFWWHGGSLGEIAGHYLLSPALFWILASFLLWGMGWLALVRLWSTRRTIASPAAQRARQTARPTDPLLLTIALLHAAFVFAFYAWEGSWTYYSYLPVIGLLVGLRSTRQQRLLTALVLLGLLGISAKFNDGWNRWMGMVRSPEVGGLWVYPEVLDEAREVRALAQQHHGLYMVNGALPSLWPEAQTPPSWFLSPGIPTATEIEKARRQIAAADMIVLYKEYDPNQEAWAWPEFAAERAQFQPKVKVHDLVFWKYTEKTKYFQVLERIAGN